MANLPTPPHTQSPVLRDIEGSTGEEEEAVTPLDNAKLGRGVGCTVHESIFAPLEGIPPDRKN